MTSLSMGRQEREEFLADVHIGVLGISRGEKAPILVPVWYRYVDGVVEISTSSATRKVALVRANPRVTLCVQNETNPPAYVSVEGTVTIEELSPEVTLAIASRYLGPEAAAQFMAVTEDDTLLRLHVDMWRSTDFAKMSV